MVTAVALVALVGAGSYGYSRLHTVPAASRPTAPLPTASITRGDLVATLQLTGQLGYLGAYSVVGLRPGTVTGVPVPGAVINRGQPVYAVDQRPIPLLYGQLPVYRPLDVDTTGVDVRQFEENLVALGHGRGVTVDERYTPGTAEAVRRWQRAYGVPVTGRLAIGDAVVAPGPLRVGTVTPLVGQAAEPGAVVVTGTGTQHGVRVQVQLANRGYAVERQPVSVRLPDGRGVPGEVSAVGTAAEPPRTGSQAGTAGQSGGQGATACQGVNCPQTVPVDIAITAPESDLRGVHEGTAGVAFTAETRRGVLSVPVEALGVGADGRFTVVVVDGANRRVVPVTTGLFTAGRVEVSGPDVAEGATVEVPAI